MNESRRLERLRVVEAQDAVGVVARDRASGGTSPHTPEAAGAHQVRAGPAVTQRDTPVRAGSDDRRHDSLYQAGRRSRDLTVSPPSSATTIRPAAA
ncbi:hypothetical protein ABT116_18040 [Streptomyces sp. NPDC002130]|uniref:hypothetical protein n=1 Tax=Streptomyces sp. NPDC002130 TaxID=3155568 RepID=UPI00331E5627